MTFIVNPGILRLILDPVFFQFPRQAGDTVQDAVHESPGFFRSVFLGDFYGLVDRYAGGNVDTVENFIDRHPQDIAIDDRHAVKAPVLGALMNEVVDLGQVFVSPLDDLFRKSLDVLLGLKLRPEAPERSSRRFLFPEVELKQYLERVLPRLASLHLECRSPIAWPPFSAAHRFSITSVSRRLPSRWRTTQHPSP